MEEEGRYIPDEIPDDFWQIIGQCEGSPDALKTLLSGMPAEDVLRFCWNYKEAIGQIATLYYDLTGFSEDTVDDICSWVVAQGEDAFTRVWNEAEELITDASSPYGKIQCDPGLLDTAIIYYKAMQNREVPVKNHDRFV